MKIEIRDLSKTYGATRALDNVTICLERNKIYGLLGRNGAGKTTLLNILTNKIAPTSGEVLIGGSTAFENDDVLCNIYYMMEKNLFPEGYKVREIFAWTKEFYPKFDSVYANSLAQKFGLNTDKKVKELSTGYGSIFKAILALSSNAPILIFDEPVLGLDANHRDMFYREVISNYSEHPKTIIISTHLIEEVADILEEAIIIKRGKIILKQSVEEMLSQAYTVSGESSKVDQYIASRRVGGVDTMGKFKSATVLEPLVGHDEAVGKEMGLDFSRVELQKLFISLTNS